MHSTVVNNWVLVKAKIMSGRLMLENCQLDLGGHALLRDGKHIAIEPTDFKVLLHLVNNAPDCVSTELLLRNNWSSTVVGDNSLHQVIRRLRVALGDSARSPKFIQTLAKVGYRFIGRVEDAGAANGGHNTMPQPILVVPFQHYSPDMPDPFVAGGLQIELRQQLIKAGAEVLCHESITGLAGQDQPIAPATADARLVLSGAIARQDERLRVNASLSDIQTNRLLWSETYDCEQASLFDTHTRLARKISGCVATFLNQGLLKQRGDILMSQVIEQ